MVNLGVLNGGSDSSALGVSSDGKVVVGVARDGDVGDAQRAFHWTQSSGMISLGVLAGHDFSKARAVSGDGNVVVGASYKSISGSGDQNFSRAFRWSQQTGMVSLGDANAFAAGVNADGSVIVGSVYVDIGSGFNGTSAFRWTTASGMVNIGSEMAGFNSFANAVNSDGGVVVGGFAQRGGNAHQPTSAPPQAFRWTQSTGMVGLGFLDGKSYSSAYGVNNDGTVVVGEAADGFATNAPRAFRWTQATGMQSVETWLRTHGVRISQDITARANGVSSDGSLVVGDLINGSAFIARVSTIGSGLIAIQELQSSLSGNANAAVQVANLGSLVLNGTHSRPLARRVEQGKSCFWGAADIGRDDHDARDGSFGLPEIGGCHRFQQNVQGSLSLGRTSSRQNLVFNGQSDVDTTYGVAELLGNLPGTNLWPSAALLYQYGDADARRGYLNAGVPDYSSGRPDVQTTALRLRMDWENAANLGIVKLTPYTDVSFARTRIDAYTEDGGGFPARFDARTEKTTELRLGVDAARALSSAATLLGRLEAAHRFEKHGASTSGTALGLFSFDFPRQQYKRDWLRAGVGVEAKLGNGVASIILNATTQGAVPSYWLNMSYQVAF